MIEFGIVSKEIANKINLYGTHDNEMPSWHDFSNIKMRNIDDSKKTKKIG